MTTAILLLMGAGIAWTLVGVAFSRAAEQGIHPVQTVFASAVSFTVLSLLLVPRWNSLTIETRVLELFLWMLVSGGASCGGLILLQAAMRRGAHGVSWGIAQGALTVPFVLGVLLFHDRAEPHRWLALISILTGIAFLSKAGLTGGVSKQGVLLACAAFLVLGVQQTSMSIPSRWAGWVDIARLRVPFFAAATTIFSGVMIAVQRPPPSRRVWLLGLVAAAGNMTGQLLIVLGLDRLAEGSLASIAYPVAIATSMAAFVVWRTFFKKEPITVPQIVSLIAIIAGALLIAS